MIKLLKNFQKREWFLSLVSIIFIVVQVWLDLTMPEYMSEITMLVQTPGSEMVDIIKSGALMLLCAFSSLLASIIVALCASRIATNFGSAIRGKLFNKVQSFSMEEMGRFSTASLITRSTNDVTQVQMFIVMGLQMLIKAPIMSVWAILKISGKEWQWTFSTAAAVVILLIVVGISLVLALPRFKKMQTLTDELNRTTRENLSGRAVVRAYNAEKYQEDKFETANTNLTNNQLFAQRTMAFLMPSIQLIMSGLSLSIYWMGAVLINNVDLMLKASLFSDMMVFSQYAIQVVMSFMMLVMIFMMLPRASVSIKRINEVLDTKASIIDGELVTGAENVSGKIEFKKVSFAYPDAEEKVLKDISFTAEQGETIAIIGATGSGKSTLINLIPRLYDVTSGEVLVDGVNVKLYNQKSLRDKISYVSQKAILFGGSIESNVIFGDNGKPDLQNNLEKSLDIAQATEFVSKTTDGYQSHVAQGGTNFSGGQKQRISIARAIARDPEIFIFDDSFSALDYKTDKSLRQALSEHCGHATRIIVAQRIGTIRDADKIIVLDDGVMVGIGKHNDLMKNCDVYQEIALSQLSQEELE